jgi:hypothetical protein
MNCLDFVVCVWAFIELWLFHLLSYVDNRLPECVISSVPVF